MMMMILRLKLQKAAIIVGGQILSRGLTIEAYVSFLVELEMPMGDSFTNGKMVRHKNLTLI